MKAKDMNIQLNGLKLYAYHGVLPQENRVGAEYIINLKLTTDFSSAAEKDSLEDTINYAEVYEAVKEEMLIPSQLLEHVAWRIARHLFSQFPDITEIKIALYKQNPPMGADCQQVGIEAVYTR
ncbi:dihydroneopterin aldolase [uncultured Bacteroides sp.]|uniref:dihydroneopterin aldolase n=1 Tax=uncultured Bacteroides sp. TaxID=162156 RepID=UPI002606E345|nr:dihydroneopterin aldolase [uncultured Bacteroides sp.]